MTQLREEDLNAEQRRALARLRARAQERAAEAQVAHLAEGGATCSCAGVFVTPGGAGEPAPSCGPHHAPAITFVIPGHLIEAAQPFSPDNG